MLGASNVFHELFVLELANNHLGNLERGLRIIRDFSKVARFNGIGTAIKLQVRDVDGLIHKDFRERKDIRYVRKTLDTTLSYVDLATLSEAIRKSNCLRMATPFDERSVDVCVEIGIDILKIASSDMNDWPLIEKIASTRKPVIASTGGSSVADLDALVRFFDNRKIPLALNHCVSLYPTEDAQLQLNQIDFLRDRYPGHVIGFSTHEYKDWQFSIAIAYAKGARTFERHIDIDLDGVPVSPYCSRPENIDTWFKAFLRAKEMCGAPGTERTTPAEAETRYLDTLVRGVYARRDLPAGHVISGADVYLAIPLQKGQISCRELIGGEKLTKAVAKDAPVRIDVFDSPYARNPNLRGLIENRGLDPGGHVSSAGGTNMFAANSSRDRCGAMSSNGADTMRPSDRRRDDALGANG
jgi:N-acetylneuraminate synthase